MVAAAAHRAFCDCFGASVQRIRDWKLMYGTRQLLGVQAFGARKTEKWMLPSQSSLQTSTAQLALDMPMLSLLTCQHLVMTITDHAAINA